MTSHQKEQFLSIRKALDSFVNKIIDNPVEINENPLIIRRWKEGNYQIDDIRLYKNIPYKCVQAHDSTDNPTWTPDVTPSLWMQYHGTSIETARPWIQPTGAHDMYKKNEYMIWTDNKIYRCINDTTYSPTEYAQIWEVI